MKLASFVIASCFSFLAASSGFAANSTSAKLPKKSVPSVVTESAPVQAGTSQVTLEKPETAFYQDRVSVSFVVPTGSDLAGGNFNLQTEKGLRLDGAADLSTNSPFGINAQFKTPIKGSLDVWGATTLEGQRSLDAINLTANGQKSRFTFTNKPSFRPLVVEGGLGYRFNKMIYAMTGMNYTLANFIEGGQLNGMEMVPALGYCYGVGARILPEFGVELIQREVRYTSLTGKFDDTGYKVRFNDLKMAGLTLMARYTFQ